MRVGVGDRVVGVVRSVVVGLHGRVVVDVRDAFQRHACVLDLEFGSGDLFVALSDNALCGREFDLEDFDCNLTVVLYWRYSYNTSRTTSLSKWLF